MAPQTANFQFSSQSTLSPSAATKREPFCRESGTFFTAFLSTAAPDNAEFGSFPGIFGIYAGRENTGWKAAGACLKLQL